MNDTNPSTASHLIFGAGLIGGFMAGSFSASGLCVSVLAREKYRSRFAGELVVTDYTDQRLSAKDIAFFTQASEIGQHFDFIWITVKSTGLEQVIKDIDLLVDSDSVLISCQNGLGSEKRLKAKFPNHRVLRAIMQSNVADIGDAHLHRGSQGVFEVESFSLANQSLAQLVSSVVLPARSIENIESSVWAKLQLNLANAVNALADIPVREMLSDRSYRKIIAQAMRELIAVSDHKRIDLAKISAVPMKYVPTILDLPNWLFEIVGRSMLKVDPSVRTSMWWDLHNGRLTEIDYLNGALVEEAKRLGVPCLMNQKIVDLVHQVEESGRHTGLPAEAFCVRS